MFSSQFQINRKKQTGPNQSSSENKEQSDFDFFRISLRGQRADLYLIEQWKGGIRMDQALRSFVSICSFDYRSRFIRITPAFPGSKLNLLKFLGLTWLAWPYEENGIFSHIFILQFFKLRVENHFCYTTDRQRILNPIFQLLWSFSRERLV